TQGNMFVRDALLSGHLYDLDQIWRIDGSYMMYKQGEAVIDFIATNFGDDAVIQILDNWWKSPEFTLVLQQTIGMNLYELNDAFMRYVKRRYYPSVLNFEFADDVGERLTPPRSFHSRVAAATAKDGETEYYALSAKDGAVVVSAGRGSQREGWREEVLVKGGRSEALESLPAFRSKIEAHGDTLIFVSKSSERDVIYLWSVSKKKKIGAFEFEGLPLIQSPTLSGDGRRMVFSAIDSRGLMDLFLVHLQDRRLERLTEDGFSDDEPDYHPSEDRILFVSDRSAGEHRDRTHIYEMDLGTREFHPVEGGPFADSNPEWSPDGKSFLFTSDREGTPNIYLNRGDVIARQTNVVTGVTTPAFLPDGKAFVATVYQNAAFDLYRFPLQTQGARLLPLSQPDSTVIPWSRRAKSEDEFVTKPYQTHFGVDFVGAGVAIDPQAGEVGNGGQLVMTDVLGNHQISVVFGTTTEDLNDFWKEFNAAVAYVNLSHRMHYYLSGFHLNSYGYESIFSQRERRVGGALGLSYPLNKFERVDGSLVGRYVEQGDAFSFVTGDVRSSVTGSAFLSYVRDNTLWTIGGPLLGWRYYVTGGYTVDFLGRGFDSTLMQLDVRKYIKLTPRVVFAARYTTRNIWGGDDQLFYLGGPWSLRGYRYREFFGRTTHLFNTELRFPLLDGLNIILPFGPIEFPMFRGSLFFDAGKVTRNDFAVFDTDWLGTVGTGVELNLGYAPVIRVNFTWQTDFDRIYSDTGFELFIGYNY
ncbi:MAG TPA: BamA/TamA family outer membrane protein, partial [Candidatus Krumholzibacteria bacterium]|nr:BamA/TamA family outer membrane protein [Candidatus Krumholzibacteria bacterium]